MNWINIRDKLPFYESDMGGKNFKTKEVIVCDGNGDVFVCEFQAGNTQGFWSSFGADNITHWLPLPEPPKE
jgi:hypothetical protein